eukprot:4945348-Prymnesium_polylepis.1
MLPGSERASSYRWRDELCPPAAQAAGGFSAATAVGAVGEGARQLGGANEATDDAPAGHGGRVERRAACGARRRLA